MNETGPSEAAALAKFESLVDRLVAKMKLSQTPVPGFIVEVSGTDSILSFLVLYAACLRMGIPDRLMGIHYVHPARRRATWFEESLVPWLRQRCPEAAVLVESPLGGNQDPQRWADLHLRALNDVTRSDDGSTSIRSLPEGRNYWVAGCTNLTEHELGKYTLLSAAVSIQPIRNLRKKVVLSMCQALDVPSVAIDNAMIPDCLCGRDELAAQNISTIDDILSNDVDPREHDPATLHALIQYVGAHRKANFRTRTPYLV